jgi:hypothetical protein
MGRDESRGRARRGILFSFIFLFLLRKWAIFGFFGRREGVLSRYGRVWGERVIGRPTSRAFRLCGWSRDRLIEDGMEKS